MNESETEVYTYFQIQEKFTNGWYRGYSLNETGNYDTFEEAEKVLINDIPQLIGDKYRIVKIVKTSISQVEKTYEY